MNLLSICHTLLTHVRNRRRLISLTDTGISRFRNTRRPFSPVFPYLSHNHRDRSLELVGAKSLSRSRRNNDDDDVSNRSRNRQACSTSGSRATDSSSLRRLASLSPDDADPRRRRDWRRRRTVGPVARLSVGA